jgi:hypothetical protein
MIGYSTLDTGAQRGYLAAACPDPDGSIVSEGGTAEGGQGINEHLLQGMHVCGDTQLMVLEAKNGIANQLSGSVIGYATAALHAVDGDAHRIQRLLSGQDVSLVGGPSQGDDRLVF